MKPSNFPTKRNKRRMNAFDRLARKGNLTPLQLKEVDTLRERIQDPGQLRLKRTKKDRTHRAKLTRT